MDGTCPSCPLVLASCTIAHLLWTCVASTLCLLKEWHSPCLGSFLEALYHQILWLLSEPEGHGSFTCNKTSSSLSQSLVVVGCYTADFLEDATKHQILS